MDTNRAVVLRGLLKNYHKERATGDFLLSDLDRSAAGFAAVASALAGSGGAIGLASLADTKEEANKVQFEIDGREISGWLMWSPFQGGDDLEVVAEPLSDGTYRAFAILRPSDRTIALYPHCSRGRLAYFKNVAKWFLLAFVWIAFGSCGIMAAIFFIRQCNEWVGFFELMSMVCGASFAIYGVIAINLARRFMPFVKMAEGIFLVLGWDGVEKIDLPRRSKGTKRMGE
ncbi:putative type VI secretion system effector [Burkholderia oklahomensis]|uniref:putative type VI secretion system effector n=1 Tax=Burkholderia oklahomensis TaxID=342113 RepID=UPI0005D96092|nr:putative type VI secretion system effector [Burkholderia oklahomensis]AJX31564.1 hypothetical protein BG90_42 [Burkholderia oklahomensis C6786]MBI0361138.1 hypothetical protein [Burkholderia oklahomensis]SUW54808.1 Uncharacterised protein [Burkholderia oklahomensis]